MPNPTGENAGRPPKPTNLKILHGNPGRRPLNQDEPQPKSAPAAKNIFPKEWRDLISDPEAKDHIAAVEAKKVFDRQSRYLRRVGLLTEADVEQFLDYCWACGNIVQCRALNHKFGACFNVWATDKDGNYIRDEQGMRVLRGQRDFAHYRHYQFWCRERDRLSSKFGFNPSDRSRIKLDHKPAEEDAMMKFIMGE